MARTSRIHRTTAETDVRLELDLDGSGTARVATGVGFFDHMLNLLARHGAIDLTVEARGDLDVDQHHTVEDVAICLGRAFCEALGDKAGIVRMSNAEVPMDEALSSVAVDISGRGSGYVFAPFTGSMIGDLESDMVRHFLQTFAVEGRLRFLSRAHRVSRPRPSNTRLAGSGTGV